MASRVLLAVILLYCVSVRADYSLSLHLISYMNPSHTCADPILCNPPRSCDSYSSACDNYFRFCLRTYGQTDVGLGTCYLRSPFTTMYYPEDNDNITFSSGGPDALGLLKPNPFIYHLAGLWNNFQLYGEVVDRDRTKDDDLVDVFIMDVNVTATLGSYILGDPLAGRFGIGFLYLNVSLTCRINFYGPDCLTYCRATNDDTGHYTCDSEGNKVCNQGYRNPLMNCTECLPREGCSAVGGYCNLPGECLCNSSYYGPNCSVFCLGRNNSSGHYSCDGEGNIVCIPGYKDLSTNCTDCVPSAGCSPVGGYCELPGQCLCRDGFNGTSCTIDLDVCRHGEPCQNGVTCESTGPDAYLCTCVEGFEGENCESVAEGSSVDSSGSSSSSAGAIAGGVVGGFLALVVVMVIVVVVVVLVCRKSNEVAGSQPSPVDGLSPPPPMYTPPMDNPMYDNRSSLIASPGNRTMDYTFEFDNPIYGNGT